MRIDTCMFSGYLFFMGVGVGISFWYVLKLSEWNQSLFWNFWGPPNLSSSCDNIDSYVKHVSFKSVIFGRYKKIIKTAENSRKVALWRASTLPKKIACGPGLRWLCEASACIAEVPIVCQIFARKAGTWVTMVLKPCDSVFACALPAFARALLLLFVLYWLTCWTTIQIPTP